MVTIRRGHPDDCPAALELLLLAFGELRGKIQPESSVLRETTESLRGRLDSQTLLVAHQGDEPNGELVGCVFCFPKENALYFGRLAVHPDARGRGIAQQLIDRVEAEAERLGYQTVFLEVRIALEGNHALFKRCGYEITSSHAHDGYEYPTYYTMTKSLHELK